MPLPDQITVVAWPRYVQVMRDIGLWRHIEDRLVREGGEGLQRLCDDAFQQVRSAERIEVAAAIRGSEGYEALWERTPSSR